MATLVLLAAAASARRVSARGDTLVFVTDGIRSGFADKLSALEPPQKSADRILAEYCRGSDDALVVVTRYLENQK